MKKNRKSRRAEIKTLPQAKAKRVLTEAERKDHEYRLRQKWTEKDTKDALIMLAYFCLIETFLLYVFFTQCIPERRCFRREDLHLVEVVCSNAMARNWKVGRTHHSEIIVEDDKGSKYTIYWTGFFSYASHASAEEYIPIIRAKERMEVWVKNDSNNIVCFENEGEAFDLDTRNASIRQNCREGFAFVAIFQTVMIIPVAVYIRVIITTPYRFK